MGFVVHGQTGQIYHAKGHPDFQRVRPLYCFVPHGQSPGFYMDSRWPSINAGANPNSIGSHVLPDFNRPVSRNLRCPVLTAFLANIPRYIGKVCAEDQP